MAESIEQALVAKVRQLPFKQQNEVLDFASFLASRERPAKPRKTIRGLWKDLGIRISADEISAARKEMWAGVEDEHRA